jgi:DNA-binding response OmpR family regulator
MEATTGREGLTAALTNPPDIIVTDFQMPEMDGVELCTRLRSNRASASVPAILLTARGHVLDDAHLRATNIRKVIDKPFSAREVVSAVESILRTKDQQSEGARDAA